MVPVHIRKQGDVFTVFMDERGQPMNLAGPEDNPPGAMPMTFVGEGELKAVFPSTNYKFVFHEQQRTKQITAITDPPELQEAVSRILSGQGLPPKGVKSLPGPAVATAVPVVDGKAKALAFLSKLETALEYASTKHKKTLETKISAVKDLITEVWGG